MWIWFEPLTISLETLVSPKKSRSLPFRCSMYRHLVQCLLWERNSLRIFEQQLEYQLRKVNPLIRKTVISKSWRSSHLFEGKWRWVRLSLMGSTEWLEDGRVLNCTMHVETWSLNRVEVESLEKWLCIGTNRRLNETLYSAEDSAFFNIIF